MVLILFLHANISSGINISLNFKKEITSSLVFSTQVKREKNVSYEMIQSLQKNSREHVTAVVNVRKRYCSDSDSFVGNKKELITIIIYLSQGKDLSLL